MVESPKPPEKGPGGSPPPLNLLDTVLRDDGPLPPARFGIRSLAFLMDFVLLILLSTFIIWKLVLPYHHPGALKESSEWFEALINWAQQTERGAIPEPSLELKSAIAMARDLQILIFWVYFAVGEAFFGGSSLGKRACRLRSISTITLGPLPIMSGIVRGGLKTLCLFFLPPMGLAVTLLASIFNSRRQLGHDLLSRTAVVDERRIQMKNS
ncbi:RDD family protein [Coraliomargarita parva]|uniref:RDD family protein n=1 Tax=Coraliomargarita parva TaxID=3014050 RepID=UPI0022B5C36C|nr:RDD family protein [Coraliomargarita parva]